MGVSNGIAHIAGSNATIANTRRSSPVTGKSSLIVSRAEIDFSRAEDALADYGITIRELPRTPARLFALLSARRP